LVRDYPQWLAANEIKGGSNAIEETVVFYIGFRLERTENTSVLSRSEPGTAECDSLKLLLVCLKLK
jgi:hypothetical protein